MRRNLRTLRRSTNADAAPGDDATRDEEIARREHESHELRERISAQWAEVRAARGAMDREAEIGGGTSNFQRARVPYGVDLAAAWGWRFLVIAAAGALILWLLNFFLVVVLPVVIALLITALILPFVDSLTKAGLPRQLAALITVALGIGVIVLLFTFVGSQISTGASNLTDQVGNGIEQIRSWLRTGPLHISDQQISAALQSAQDQLKAFGTTMVGKLSEIGATLGHVLAGLFIVLFSTYFFLADGARIWSWVVRLFPRAGRLQADSSGRVAWASLTQFVRATVMVAAVDAIGIMIGAFVLGVPFVSAIGVLVFIGAFVPLVGATVSGAVAVLVALVSVGPLKAAILLGVVIGVQQLEAHVLQPFLMGRFVSVHPLGVIIAIAMGILVAGIAGALVAVPLAASLNAVVNHLARQSALAPVGPEPDPDDDEGAVGDTDITPADDAEREGSEQR